MKKLKYLFVLLMALLVLPFMVYAEGEEETTAAEEDSKEVNVYLFRGEGCPHCQEAEEWFASIEEEYGSYFKIVDYETWYDEENAELMQKVADARGEEAQGVPYIIIGDKSWNGFTDSYEEEIIEQIKAVYEQDIKDRYDIMELLPNINKTSKKSSSNDVFALVIILVIVGGAAFGVYKARSNTN